MQQDREALTGVLYTGKLVLNDAERELKQQAVVSSALTAAIWAVQK